MILSILPRNDSWTADAGYPDIPRHVFGSSPPPTVLVVGVQHEMRGARVTSRGGTRGANVRTTCVGGSVLLSFTLAKSQSRPTPTVSHPSHPSRSFWQSPSPPRSSTLPGFAQSPLYLSLFLCRSLSLSHPLLSSFLLLFFSSLKRVCASTRFIAALHRSTVSLLRHQQ